MRTTLNTIYSKIQSNLGRITTGMSKINDQISSGQQMGKISDEPVSLVSALRFRSSVVELDQYTENIQNGNTIITAAETALTQMKELALRAKTLAIQATDPAFGTANRQAIAAEVQNLFEQSVYLANTQINGKYIFGGFRTTGYTDLEPAPFIIDKGDGYWLNSAPLPSLSGAPLTGSVATAPSQDIADGDLLINDVNIGPVVLLPAALNNGLNMAGAAAIRAAVNGQSAATGVTASFTTLYAGGAVNPDTADLVDSVFTFDLNGIPLSVTTPDGGDVALATVNAVQAAAEQTGVTAEVGDGNNGGAPGTVVFRNVQSGDESAITVANFTPVAGDAAPGFGNFSQAADATHNSGQLSLSSDQSLTLTSPNNPGDDLILDLLGLGGGISGVGLTDQAADGVLTYGYRLGDNALTINGIAVPAATDDTLSDVFADASAAAKATAINAITGETGVTAVVTPAQMQATGGVSGGTTIDSGDLRINGIDIFAGATAIVNKDNDNVLLTAINAQTGLTGIKATRDQDGFIQLTAEDGRNIHVKTTANGEAVTHLTGGSRDLVSFGSLQLRSDRMFTLETVDPTVDPNEPGLAALGLAGGEATSGEPGDLVADGKIEVKSIHNRAGTVRYAGDRINNMEIKIGKTTTMTIGDNGKSAVMDTTLFTTLKAFEDYLLVKNFTTVTGIHAATDTGATLNSRTTGLEPESLLSYEDLFTQGAFTVTVTDHDYSPPRERPFTIGVDPELDTLMSVSQRIDGIPHLSASWTSDGRLKIESDDPARYTIALTDDSSNFLQATGVSEEFMQSEGISHSMDNLDTLMENLTRQVSDFGARANRIDIQSQIYSTMTIATKENLSEVQDTDMIKALMELKAKETAYQAALSSAAKTMQLSLVDYLR